MFWDDCGIAHLRRQWCEEVGRKVALQHFTFADWPKLIQNPDEPGAFSEGFEVDPPLLRAAGDPGFALWTEDVWDASGDGGAVASGAAEDGLSDLDGDLDGGPDPIDPLLVLCDDEPCVVEDFWHCSFF